MTRTEALPHARRIAAAVCESLGQGETYCKLMRGGAYDDDHEVQIALAALVAAPRLSPLMP